MTDDLFRRLVERSGLSTIFAEQTLSRALGKAGVDRKRLLPRDITRALPEIERALGTYLDASEVQRAVKAISELGG